MISFIEFESVEVSIHLRKLCGCGASVICPCAAQIEKLSAAVAVPVAAVIRVLELLKHTWIEALKCRLSR